MTLPIQPGDTLLGKYRVESLLGKGGMGVVVAARHIELGELFAIKFLLPAALAHPDAVERFLREARASARLKGEHVVKVQDVGRLSDGMPYMVMEHLAGSDLKNLVQSRGPLPVAEAINYVLQACEALAEAHSLGIVHRDLKPANMFLVRRPNGLPCVKVLDFGISKQIETEKAEQHALTRTGMVLGSPMYMSPEQMLHTKEADPRGDIWSMGVVLYQLVTGTVPFLADAVTEVIGKVLQEEPRPPSYHRADIPPALDAVVMKCLQKRVGLRFQTVAQLVEALHGVLAIDEVPASGPTAVLPRLAPVVRFQPSGEPRTSQPSSSAAVAGTAPFPVVVTQGSPTQLETLNHPLQSNAAPNSAPLTGLPGQTGQAWGRTDARQSSRSGAWRTGVLIGAVLAGLALVSGGIAVVRMAISSEAPNTMTSSAAQDPVTAAPNATVTGLATGSAAMAEPAPSALVSSIPVASATDGPAAATSPSTTTPIGASANARRTGEATAKVPAKPIVTGASAAPATPSSTVTTAPVPPPPTTQSGKTHGSMY